MELIRVRWQPPWHRELAKAGQRCTETQMAWQAEERGHNQGTRCPLGTVGHLLYNPAFVDRAMAAAKRGTLS